MKIELGVAADGTEAIFLSGVQMEARIIQEFSVASGRDEEWTAIPLADAVWHCLVIEDGEARFSLED